MGHNQTLSFCIAKETINKIKRQSMDWKKIFPNDATEKDLISKTYQELIWLSNSNNKINK